tara:strand:- start:1001 stop:1591 length:591 start_codon:yes stop_codon:yes gene_type:complete
MNVKVNNTTYSIVPNTLGFKEMNYTVETKMGMPFMDPISEEILKPIVEYMCDINEWYYTYPAIIKSPSWTKLYDDVKLKPIIEIVKAFNDISRVKDARIQRVPKETEISRHKETNSEWGVRDGNIVRFRMPMSTNSLVKFSIWDHNEFKYDFHMNIGKFYYTDIRKYHSEENLSDTDSMYLQIDSYVNNTIRQAIC